MVGPTTTVIQPTSTSLTKVDSARDIVLVRSKIRNNSANTPKRGLKLYRLNSAKNTTTIRPVTGSHAKESSDQEILHQTFVTRQTEEACIGRMHAQAVNDAQ